VESLSALNPGLLEVLRQDPSMAAQRVGREDPAVPAFLRDYRFPVSAWPVFVSQHIVREGFQPLAAAIPQIFHKAIRARFQNDSASFAAYFGWPRRLYDILVRAPVDPRELLVRYDALWTGDGIKLLEINCSSSLGGWQLDYFEPDLNTRLARYPQTRDWNIQYRRIFPGMLRRVLDAVQRRKPRNAQGHILFHSALRFALQGIDPPAQCGMTGAEGFAQVLQTAYDAVRPPAFPRGRIFLFDDFGEIRFKHGGEVSVGGAVMDAVILAGTLTIGVPEEVQERLTAAHLANHIIFPDSPFHTLLGDKRLFALVHECRTREVMNPDEAAVIDRHIPWTTRLRDDTVTVDGIEVPLVRHLLAHKDDFVLKRADSYAGQHVVIGRYRNATEWEATVARGIEEDRWVAQRFCAPGRLEVHDHDCTAAAHDLIWGIFGFGGEYGGAFVRGQLADDHRAGVINSANGATEFLVFEENNSSAAATPPAAVDDAPLREAGLQLSSLNERLLTLLRQEEAMRARRINLQSPATVGFMRDYKSSVSVWPVFVSRAIVERQFGELVEAVPKVFDRALRAFFRQDGQAFAEYFGWPRQLYDILLRIPSQSRPPICRYDVVLDRGDLKVLEMNCGSSAGGWETDWLASFVHEALRDCPGGTQWNICHRATFEYLLHHIVQCILQQRAGRTGGNIVLYSFLEDVADCESLQRSAQAVYDRLKPSHFAPGRIILITDCSQLSFSPRRELMVDGEPVDALLLTLPDGVEVPPAVLDALNTAYLSNQLVFPDSSFHNLFGTKLMLALAHEACESGLLTGEDAGVVKRFIPWTVALRDRAVMWRGIKASAGDLLTANQDAFVLKKATSWAGQDVLVGRYMTVADWTSALASALTTGGWIAQEYCAPGRILTHHPDHGICPHDLIWGVFGFGGSYAGAFVRARRTADRTGVINSATGATEFLVFEDLG
jgi:hypothetical protein